MRDERRPPYSYRADPAVPGFRDDKPVIVFDGYCVLCSRWAQFVLKHDGRRRYRLLTAQSVLGRALYRHYGLDTESLETNLLIEDGVAWVKSAGSIRMAEGLGWPWRAAAALRVLPRSWADRLYACVAHNRLRWFGTREACYVPAPDDADRFLSR